MQGLLEIMQLTTGIKLKERVAEQHITNLDTNSKGRGTSQSL